VTVFGNYEFVSVQGTGQIFSYNISGSSQALVGPPYTTSCLDPSGMVVTTIGGSTVLAVVCYDGNSLLTLRVAANGTLSALGSVGGLAIPYPGITLMGTDVLVPLFGQPQATNGGVARVSIANPSSPTITGSVTLASPASGEFANPGYLTVANGYIFVTAGSESSPLATSSTIQVVNEATMALVGSPFTVAHSPQQIAVQGSVAYVTLYDATQLESIDISNPSSLQALQILSLASPSESCHGVPILLQSNFAYVGCYSEGTVEVFNVSAPSNMVPTRSFAGVPAPQRFALTGTSLLATSSVTGGGVYEINTGAP
jgi:hypothetical protein